MADAFDLARFVAAQEPVFDAVLAELRHGRRRTHWMWFVFPQIKGLGFSENARYYGIGSRAEAIAYGNHPVLGPRLLECTTLVNSVQNRTAEAIFGEIDAVKFRSSMTLFDAVGAGSGIFREALDKYFDGAAD